MNRRNFLRILTGSAVAAVAAEAIPFNRVWSFPSKIRLATEYQVFNPIFDIPYTDVFTGIRFDPKVYSDEIALGKRGHPLTADEYRAVYNKNLAVAMSRELAKILRPPEMALALACKAVPQ